MDDLLDFTGSDIGLGKPSQGADLKLGLATAPALFAWEEFPEMGEMVMRKFEEEGDVERVSGAAFRFLLMTLSYSLFLRRRDIS